MKAERRHELKKNTLVRSLEHVPSAGRKYGPRVVLVVVFLGLLGVLIYTRWNASQVAMAQAQLHLAEARNYAREISQFDAISPNVDLSRYAAAREEAYKKAVDSADAALAEATEKQPAVRAAALLAKGDANWNMASLPPLPGAATQPWLRPEKSRSELLSAAEEAYNELIQKYPQQTNDVTVARFGLAAIAEDRAQSDPSQWDRAQAIYETIIQNNAAGSAFEQNATGRKKLLFDLQKPIRLGIPTTEPATTEPATTLPTTRPTMPLSFEGGGTGQGYTYTNPYPTTNENLHPLTGARPATQPAR